MAFSVRAWFDRFGSGGSFDQPTDTGATPDTPVDAAGLRDMETRLSGYTDSRETAEVSARNTAIGTHSADTTAVHGIADTAALATSTSVASAVAAEATARNTAISAAISAQGDLATQTELDAHVNDTTAAHAASAISVTPAGAMGSTDVQAALQEAFSELSGGGGSSAPTIQGTAAGNLGTAQTVNFASAATETWLVGVLNANLAVTVSNPVAGSRLKVLAPNDAAGNHTLTVAGTPITIPTAGSGASPPGVAMVTIDWVDATNFRVESAGVYTETDPNAILKSLGTTKGDIVAFSASATPARLQAGANDSIPVADSTATPGLSYKTLLALLNAGFTPTKGRMLAANGTNWVFTAPPTTDGHVFTADAAQATYTKWAAPAGGGSGTGPGLPMIAGKRFSPPGQFSAGANWSQGNARATAVTVMFARSCTITEVAVQLTSAGGTGCRYRIGICTDAGGFPGALVAGTAQIDVTGSNGIIAAAISAAVTTGVLYWVIITQQDKTAGSNASILGQNGAGLNPWLPLRDSTFSGATAYLRDDFSAYGTGALPSTNGVEGDWFPATPAPVVSFLAAA